MLKRTLFFTNPYHLSVKHAQLVITDKTTGEVKQTPIEDLGFVVLDNKEITLTTSVMQSLAANNTALVFCDDKHLPQSMMFHLDTHQVQTEKFRNQVDASEPLKKQLWQQTIVAKVKNQAAVLKKAGRDDEALIYLASKVKSGDSDNIEAQAAKRYWRSLFGETFKRERYGAPPNPSLNYGYAILRGAVARALVGSGLLPTLGIYHRNKYNAYCLADDIMEPYRPFVDLMVREQMDKHVDYHVLDKHKKAELMQVLSIDVQLGKKTSPLMVALSHTTASLSRCFDKTQKNINYPLIV